VWIYEWDQGRHAGLIINKPTDHDVGHLLSQGSEWGRAVMRGGPVQSSGLILMHSPEWRSERSFVTQAPDHTCLTSDRAMLSRLVAGDQPRLWQLIMGLCVWTPGQLEREIGQGFWMVDPESWTTAQLAQMPKRDPWRRVIERSSQILIDKMFEIK
jgi:putative AlgH/UPF0301 family transcriptional regulator